MTLSKTIGAVLFGALAALAVAGPAAADTWRFANAASPGDRAETSALRMIEIINQSTSAWEDATRSSTSARRASAASAR
jgi:hypothetical protein